MKKPTLEQFGLTEGVYEAFYRPFESPFTDNVIRYTTLFVGGAAGLVFLIIWGASGRFENTLELWWVSACSGFSVGFAFLLVFFIALMIINPILERNHKASLPHSPIAERVRRYENALSASHDEDERKRREVERKRQEIEWTRQAEGRARQMAEKMRIADEKARQKKLADYWLNLDGLTFERELGDLYRKLGYDVKTTPGTGDKGVDLILKKNGLTTVVQCKRHTAPVGPAIARDMYGAMVSFGADNAILACTSGFTPGVLEFVKDKPISLVSAKEILALVESTTPNPA